MLASVILGTILFIIALVIYLEYRNEKKYRQDRLKREEAKRKPKKPEPKISKRPAAKKPVTSEPEKKPEIPSTGTEAAETQKSVPAAEPSEREERPSKAETKPEAPVQNSTAVPHRSEPSSEKTPEKQQQTSDLPKGDYPDFNYDRLLEMGLSEEEAVAFIQELIPQIGEQIPLLDEAMKIPDFHKMERLTHSIKGSSTTIGTGGVSDLLTDYNTYLKTGNELSVAEAYQEHLKRYFEKLKKQFPPKE